MDAAMVLGNSHLFMSRTNRLAVIASHTQERYGSFSPLGKFEVFSSICPLIQHRRETICFSALRQVRRVNEGDRSFPLG